MKSFTLWEKGSVGGWQPAMTYETRMEAVSEMVKWGRDFFESNGFFPVAGRDYRLTEDLIVPICSECVTEDNGVRAGEDYPGTLHAGPDVPTVEMGVGR